MYYVVGLIVTYVNRVSSHPPDCARTAHAANGRLHQGHGPLREERVGRAVTEL